MPSRLAFLTPLRIVAVGIIVAAIMGFVGQQLHWWTLATFGPWILSLLVGLVLLLAGSSILPNIKKLDVLNGKIEFLDRSVKDGADRVRHLETLITIGQHQQVLTTFNAHTYLPPPGTLGYGTPMGASDRLEQINEPQKPMGVDEPGDKPYIIPDTAPRARARGQIYKPYRT